VPLDAVPSTGLWDGRVKNAVASHAYALGTSVRNFSNTGNALNSRWASDLHHSRTIGGTR
jgi:hypothetical protein